MDFKTRTHTCGELRENNVGDSVVLNGWVDRRRDLGGLIFIWLRDRYGITQVAIETDDSEVFETAKELRNEFVISVEGIVRKRPDDAINAELETGKIDVLAQKVIVLNDPETPPFAINGRIRSTYRTYEGLSASMNAKSYGSEPGRLRSKTSTPAPT